MNSLGSLLLSIKENSFLNLNKSTKKNENYDENNSDKSYDEYEEETIPDEDFLKFPKRNHKLLSCPNVEQKGPNINLKITHKRYSNQKEKEFFYEKIKRKKKTELCKNYELYHDCYFKDECSFAHGIDELRENIILPSYKTKICKSFAENKVCNFGIRCSYRHNIKTKRLFTYNYILNKRAKELIKEFCKSENKSASLMTMIKRVIFSEKLVIPRLKIFEKIAPANVCI
jgi:hypothetical protein